MSFGGRLLITADYIHLGVELLGNRVGIFLTLMDTDKTFSKVVEPICTPTSSA